MRPLIKSFEELGREQWGEQWEGSTAYVEMLRKSLATTGIPGYGDANPFLLENLDPTMTSVLFKQTQLVVFNYLAKVVSKQPLYQYTERMDYGDSRGTPGFAEGGLPLGSQGRWDRRTAEVKWMGVRRGITQQMMLTGQLGGTQIPPVEEEERGGTLSLLEKIERWCLFGRKGFKRTGGDELNYDGVYEQHKAYIAGGRATRNIVDLAGAAITRDHFEDAALVLVEDGKMTNFDNLKCFMSPSTLTGLSKQEFAKERAVFGQSAGGGWTPGMPMAGILTNFGELRFQHSIFLQPVPDDKPILDATKISPLAPPSPTAPTTGTGATSGALLVGTFYYFVSTISDGGESVPTATASGQAVTAGNHIRITLTREATAHGYRIYRGVLSNGTDAKLIASVDQFATATTTYDDYNQKVPGSKTVFILPNDANDLCLPQMSPLLKFPLAHISTTSEFALLLYHTVVEKIAERMFIMENVGDYVAA